MYHSFFETDGIGAAWNLGELDTDEVVMILSEGMSLSKDEILEHFERVDLFDFFPFTYGFFRAQHLPQAVVTVNPSIFRQMATRLGFDAVVDTIIVSGEEGTADKGALCQRALERLPGTYSPPSALLIDNRQENLDAWARRGGIGYLFTSDDAFQRDVEDGVDGLPLVGRKSSATGG